MSNKTTIPDFLHKSDQWHCSSCGAQCRPMNWSWRWSGHTWQHSHPEAQTHFDAVRCGPERLQFETFGRLMWESLKDNWPDVLAGGQYDDVIDAAEMAGLCERVAYDPEKHGVIDDSEPGDSIWWWGKSSEKGDQQ